MDGKDIVLFATTWLHSMKTLTTVLAVIISSLTLHWKDPITIVVLLHVLTLIQLTCSVISLF